MLKQIQIENYKGFKKLDTEMKRITLIGGKNNIGKTSLLEAIFLFYDTSDPSMFFRHLSWRGIEVPSVAAETLISPLFRDFNLNEAIKIKALDDIHHSEMEIAFDTSKAQKSFNVELPNIRSVPSEMNTTISYALNIRFEEDGKSKQETKFIVTQSASNLNLQFEPNPIIRPRSTMRNVVFLPLRLKTDPTEETQRFGQIDINKQVDQVIKFLQILEPRLRGLSVIPLSLQRSAIYADIGINQKVPLAYLGDGVARLLSLILAIAATQDGIVLVDEIDAGIHYSTMTKIWEGICNAARAFNCQIIATTHSYECLQSAYSGSDQANMAQEFCYSRLEDHNQSIVAKTYTHEILGAALERGWEVR